MTYIHERDDWPHFTWSMDSLTSQLARLRRKHGLLFGRMAGYGFPVRTDADLAVLTDEVVQSSAIEGESLDRGEVRSSISRRLGLDVAGLPKPSRSVEGVVEMSLDATRNFAAPLTRERLFAWHTMLFPRTRKRIRPGTVGAWRPASAGPMRVVSGVIGRERVHLEAPHADRVNAEMTRFLEWLDADHREDGVLLAGVAHLWFLTIHPFEDGNGRIGRAIADLALSRADGETSRFYSLSKQIAAERRDYYRELEGTQKGSLDITRWLVWWLDCLERAADDATRSLATVHRTDDLWRHLAGQSVHPRQRKVLQRLLDGLDGPLTTSVYARLVRCSTDTALRDIRRLVELGVLVKNPGGGRSTSYRLAEPHELRSPSM